MTLLLSNEDVESVLTMRNAIAALEPGFIDLAGGAAVNRPRSHTYTDLGSGRHYLFKTMDGSLPRFGVHCLRLSSDLTHEHEVDGVRRRDKIAAAPGGRYVGLVMLFDIHELVPLAILQDGFLQRTRVGATSALAAHSLARGDAEVAGVVGAGWQAGAQITGLIEVRPIRSFAVYSRTRDALVRFCDAMSERTGVDVHPVTSAREAIAGSDIVALATNSHDPVLSADWIEPGQHIGSVQGHELDAETLRRADLICVRSRESATYHYAPGRAPVEAAERKSLDPELADKVVELGQVLMRRYGRRSDDDVTLFTGGGSGGSSGLGIQFAAVAYAVYEAARRAGVGRELPTEWFTETAKP